MTLPVVLSMLVILLAILALDAAHWLITARRVRR